MIQRRIFPAFAAAFLVWMLLAIALPIEMARAQNPTPAPTPTLTLTEDCVVNGINQCGERVVREYGLLTFVLAVVLIAALVFVGRAFWKGASKPVAEKIENSGARLFQRGATRRYLETIIEENRYFGFIGIEQMALRRIDLDRGYVMLELVTQFEPRAGKTQADESKGELVEPLTRRALSAKPEAFTLAEIIQKTQARRWTIIGDAGSGKSAQLQWIGLSIARARLGRKQLSDDQKAFLKSIRPHQWSILPTPILIPLREFVAYCRDDLKHAPDTAALTQYVQSLGQRRYPRLNLPPDFFARQLNGLCLLMFDGVDEVNQAERDAVRGAVEGFACLPQHQRHWFIVTSRPSTADIAQALTDFRRADVQPLTDKQCAQLIDLWASAVYATSDEADRNARDLKRRIREPRVREIADTPLMVNIFALTYYYKRELPSQRAELYEFAIQTLLTDLHRPDRASAVDWGGFDVQTRRDHLALIAFILHDGRLNNLRAGELVARDELWRRFGTDKEQAQAAAREFLQVAALRGGLLRQDDNRYDFYIRRFREFLAARWMVKKLEPQWQPLIARHLDQDQWEEPLLLGAGFLAYDDLDQAEKYMRMLLVLAEDVRLAARGYATAIAGVALCDLLRHGDKTVKSRFEPFRAILAPQMLEIFEQTPPLERILLRRDLGLALGEIGDPRFSPLLQGEGQGVRFPALITIPAGEFLMGTSDAEADALQKQNAGAWDDEKPQRRVYVSEFEIGKYPITNQDFRAFWHADGYEDETLWSADGWKWRKGKLDADLSVYSKDYQETIKNWLDRRPVEKRGEPFFWRDPQWNAPNLPVVGVTWFEAEAYCKWLTRMSNQGNKGIGKQVTWRLPTEAEWERAARGPENFLWSWGNEWDANKCNSEESKFNATSPVGMYPDGTWKDEKGNVGPLDMMGNVWEWCDDWYQGDLYKTRAHEITRDPQGPLSGNARVIRGGSWTDVRWICRAACRIRVVPMVFDDFIGFRVVVVPIPRS
ncbi:MAG: hypothetical protein B6D41_06635 [Chloroflexi bacterium UTCFX4]|jgi:formylglycine-generating enzyme required for sulfatase activity|nr:MAG: hypothetical protein B6D41_06635 [Chloroflexi bacterium UTCFX4]